MVVGMWYIRLNSPLNSIMNKQQQPNLDLTNVSTIGHIRIRDPDTDEIILHQRDIEKKPENHD